MRGPHNKDYSILWSILGSTYSGKLPNYCREYRENGKENGNYYSIMGYLRGVTIGICGLRCNTCCHSFQLQIGRLVGF